MAKKPLNDPKNASQTAYEACTPIEHNLKKYAVGDSIDLTDEEADQLLEVNAIKPIGPVS